MWEESLYELSASAARQQGLITSAQASRIGADPAAVGQLRQAGLLQELDWGVYQLAGSTLAPRYAYPYAAWLAISPELFCWERPATLVDDAVLSHESACQLHGLGSVSAPAMVFSAPALRPAPRATRIHLSRLTPGDVTVCLGVPVTTPHRTLLDLVRSNIGPDEVGRAAADAVRRDLVDLSALYTDLSPLAAEYDFPADGPGFLGHFTPDIRPEALSTRNLRTYAAMLFPARVAELSERVREVVAGARTDSGSTEPAESTVDEVLSREIAAEIVGRTRWH